MYSTVPTRPTRRGRKTMSKVVDSPGRTTCTKQQLYNTSKNWWNVTMVLGHRVLISLPLTEKRMDGSPECPQRLMSIVMFVMD